MFRLRFPAGRIVHWARRYEYPGESLIETDIGPAARERGYLRFPEFAAICDWKSPRTRPRCAKNPPEFVEEVTRQALRSRDERFRIEALTLLDGVSWPTASVILHFCSKDPYPILDYRALWSLSHSAGSYNFALWDAYTRFTRELAGRHGVSMRTLDRALWQYSKEKQGPA